MTCLHTAFSWRIEPAPQGGVNIVLSELRIIPETKEIAQKAGRKFNPFGFEVTNEPVADPKEVVLYRAAPGYNEGGLLESLTDDLIYNQWFRVKEHKKKGKE